MRRRVLLVALLVAGALGSKNARADDAADRKAAAQTLFEQGREAVKRGNFGEACPKLAESQRLDPGIGTQLWLADCYENNGQTASAWAMFKEAAAAAALKQDNREQVARDRASKLEPKLSRLSILVPPGAAAQGVEVRRDGIAVGSPEWGVPVPLDPGVHTVGAVAAGHNEWTTTVKVDAQGGTLQVTVPELTIAATRPRPAEAPPSSSASPASSAPQANAGTTRRVIGVVTAGVGFAGLVVGGVLGLRAKSAYDDSNAFGHCMPDNECDATGKQDRSSAFSLATGSTVAMALGAAAMAGGVILYFTAPRDAVVSVAPTARGAVLGAAVAW
jgi:hypothetical protein